MAIAYQTDVGLRRKSNQNAVGVFVNRNNVSLSVVCDGVGGQNAGDVASALTVAHLREAWTHSSFRTVLDISRWLVQHIQSANDAIIEKAQQIADLQGMATTIVCSVVFDNTIVIAHVGDSRAYLYRHFQLKQLTEDHSLIADLVKKNVITPEEATTHPLKHVVTRSLGLHQQLAIDILTMPHQQGDLLLLCTDGLSDMVSEQRISRYFTEWATLPERAAQLIKWANEAGGRDNITVLLDDTETRKEQAG